MNLQTSPSENVLNIELAITKSKYEQFIDENELTDEEKSNELQASVSFFKSFVGSGILTLPYSFKEAGLGVSILSASLVGWVTYYTCKCYTEILDKRKDFYQSSLGQVASKILGTGWKYPVEISVILMQISICIGLMMFANQFLDYTFCTYNVYELCENKVFNGILFLSVIIPLVFISNIHYFYIPSMIGMILILIALIVHSYLDLIQITEKEKNFSYFFEKIFEFNFEKIPSVLGVISFAFEGSGTILNIRNSMKTPQSFHKILWVVMLIITILYTVFPSLAVLALEEATPEIILFSFPKTNIYFSGIRLLYAMSAILSIPLQFHPCIDITERNFNLNLMENTNLFRLKKYGMRILLIILIVIASFSIKSFNQFLNFVGSFVCSFICFILPALLHQACFRNENNLIKSILNYFIIFVGFMLGIFGISIAIKDIE